MRPACRAVPRSTRSDATRGRRRSRWRRARPRRAHLRRRPCGAHATNAAMTYRVIQWSTGNVGVRSLRLIARHPDLELVGVWVHSADKAGRDAGDLAGIEHLGVSATNDADALAALDADCVCYTATADLRPMEAI